MIICFSDADKEDKLFTGEFWMAEDAKTLGLIDGIDTLDAYLARVHGEKCLAKRMVQKPSFVQKLMGNSASLEYSNRETLVRVDLEHLLCEYEQFLHDKKFKI